jgi:hypothetical protein
MTEALVDVPIYSELEYISHSFGRLKECENRSEKFGNTVQEWENIGGGALPTLPVGED